MRATRLRDAKPIARDAMELPSYERKDKVPLPPKDVRV